ncbi:MAG: peptidoglycan-binding domain-containing protein [Myxococcota bacterium]
MGASHQVREGETLQSVALAHGRADWRAVREESGNAQLKEDRPNPLVLNPDDQVELAETSDGVVRHRGQEHRCATGKVHHFVLGTPATMLRLKLRDDGPISIEGKRYRLRVDPAEYEGTIPEGGMLEHWVPAGVDAGELTLWLRGDPQGDGQTMRLRIGHLDPATKPKGAMSRLRNLGYHLRPYDDMEPEEISAALQRFQRDRELSETGELDDETVAELESAHGV